MQNLKLKPRHRVRTVAAAGRGWWGLGRVATPGYVILCGKRFGIRGNMRTVKRQYAARKMSSVRVLPGIAGYCRVMGFSEFQMQNSKGKIDGEWGGAVRFGPAGTAWDRLGPDIFFSPRLMASGRVSGWVRECERGAVSTQVVDISSKMARSCDVSGLISRLLRIKRSVFDPFLGSSLFSVE